jgi:CheY-like chemotaxis protein
VDECISLVKNQARKKKLSIEFKEKQLAPRMVWADIRRLKQVILNLLNNAIKFTEKGSIVISSSKSKFDDNKPAMAKISVTDTGIGIKEEDMPRLFREFEMLESHKSMNPNGTGLGLYLSRKLVREMYGDIKVKSTYKKGSKFIISLPISQTPSKRKSINSSESNPSPKHNHHTDEIILQIGETKQGSPVSKSCKCKRILAVDDNDSNLMVIKGMLNKLNIDCDIARNGKEAVEAVQTRSRSNLCCRFYQLILMDCYMPVMNGFEVLYSAHILGCSNTKANEGSSSSHSSAHRG